MENVLDFLIKANKLKEMPRLGWIFMRLKKPETVAEHVFRMAILSWFLAKKRGLNVKRAIKITLAHDLCEVFAGDVTTILYHPKLLKEKDLKKRKKIQMKWSRLSQKSKKQIGEKKFIAEKKAFLELTNHLSANTKRELLSHWLDYEIGFSKEGKLVREINSIEMLIQSIEYFGKKEEVGGTTWWESTEEIVETPLCLSFLTAIQNKIYGKTVKTSGSKKELEDILTFILEIGKLKKMPRKSWLAREVKSPETVGGHIFTVSLMAWIFFEEKKMKFNLGKLLKMALCHKLPAVYLNKEASYNDIMDNKTKKQRKKIFKKWIRFSKKEKMKIFLNNYKKEKKALRKLVSKLSPDLKNEIIQLWEEFKNISTPEACFLNQVHVLANLLQALQYWEKDKKFPIDAFWERAFEVADKEMSFEFMSELKKKFYN